MGDKATKKIYKAYKKFYNKEPNLNGDNFRNLTIEIQSMVYILNKYGVSFDRYLFHYEYEDISMPMSMKLQDTINVLLASNIDDLTDDSLKFNKRANKTINIVGTAIGTAINNSQNKIEELRKISDILYVKEYVLPVAPDEKITQIKGYTKTDLCFVRNLIRLINEEMNKHNFDSNNLENVKEMIYGEMPTSYSYCIFMDESGNGELPKITEESRKKLAKALISKE